MTDISIYVSYHKNTTRLSSTILKPIHVGRALASEEVKNSLKDLTGDDIGDNISKKNLSYCELTAQYWAWKNDNLSDFIGFLHYRRHLDFNLNHLDCKPDQWGCINQDYISKDYLYSKGLYDSNITNIVHKFDLITVKPWDVTNAGSKDNYDHYHTSDKKLHIEDYEEALKILNEKFPQYSKSATEYNRSKLGYYTNIFVMKKELFHEYCDYLFGILFELEKKLDISKYDTQEKRVFGYISEWLFGIFLTYKKTQGSIKILELNRTFIQHPEIQEERDIHICTACDNSYSEYLGTCITSVLKNKKAEDRIYYYVLDGGIEKKNKEKLRNFKQYGSSYFIYFLPIDNAKLSLLAATVQNTYLTLSTYYRLLMADFLPEYLEKVIYLDADTIVRTSLFELYNQKFDQCSVLGIKDVLEKDNTRRLNLKQYVNAGVLLIDLNKWRNDRTKEKFFSFIKQHYDLIYYHDQDVLNCVLQKEIRQINPLWNAQTASYPGSEEQNENGKTAHIVHFVSDRKPWIENNGNPFEGEWIRYWKQSPWGGIKFRRVAQKRSLRQMPGYGICAKFANIFLTDACKNKIKKALKLN